MAFSSCKQMCTALSNKVNTTKCINPAYNMNNFRGIEPRRRCEKSFAFSSPLHPFRGESIGPLLVLGTRLLKAVGTLTWTDGRFGNESLVSAYPEADTFISSSFFLSVDRQ